MSARLAFIINAPSEIEFWRSSKRYFLAESVQYTVLLAVADRQLRSYLSCIDRSEPDPGCQGPPR